MKKILLFCVVVAHALTAFSQNTQTKYFIDKMALESTSDSKIEVNALGDTVMVMYFRAYTNPNTQNQTNLTKVFKGTPYLKNKWANGIIYIDGQNPTKVFMAYNIEKERVYVMYPKLKEAIELWPDGIDFEGISLRKYTGIYENASKAYYQTIHQGSIKLLKEYKCKLNAESLENKTGYESSNAGDYAGEFEKSSKFYLVYNNVLQLVNSNKKLLKALPTNQDKVEAFIKDEKINIQNEPDLLRVISYYESLQSEKI